MEGRRQKVKIVLRPCAPKLKLALIALIVCSMAALISLTWIRGNILREASQLQTQAAELEHENQELGRKIDELGSLQSAQEIAEEELGLADPDTVVVNPNS